MENYDDDLLTNHGCLQAWTRPLIMGDSEKDSWMEMLDVEREYFESEQLEYNPDEWSPIKMLQGTTRVDEEGKLESFLKDIANDTPLSFVAPAFSPLKRDSYQVKNFNKADSAPPAKKETPTTYTTMPRKTASAPHDLIQWKNGMPTAHPVQKFELSPRKLKFVLTPPAAEPSPVSMFDESNAKLIQDVFANPITTNDQSPTSMTLGGGYPDQSAVKNTATVNDESAKSPDKTPFIGFPRGPKVKITVPLDKENTPPNMKLLATKTNSVVKAPFGSPVGVKQGGKKSVVFSDKKPAAVDKKPTANKIATNSNISGGFPRGPAVKITSLNAKENVPRKQSKNKKKFAKKHSPYRSPPRPPAGYYYYHWPNSMFGVYTTIPKGQKIERVTNQPVNDGVPHHNACMTPYPRPSFFLPPPAHYQDGDWNGPGF